MPPKKTNVGRPVSKPVVKSNVPKTGAKGVAPKKAVAAKPGTNKKSTVQSKDKGGTSGSKPAKKTWTKEDEAAKRIQTLARQYLSKKELAKRKKAKEEYENLMDKLEKEAYIIFAKKQQEEYEREQQKEEEERKRRREELKRRKRFLEAAFDGDTDELVAILKEVKELDDKNALGNDIIGRVIRDKHLMAMVECEDANENSALSEASSGGNIETIQFLLDKGANPNTQGQFRRTPLYRAAFAGHLDACEVLLQNGADPRTYADDGQNPSQIASHAAIKQLMEDWDISQTERLLEKLETARQHRKEEEKKKRAAQTNQLEDELKEAEKEYGIRQKLLSKMYAELEKRIQEHDQAVASGFDRPEITLQVIHDAEADLEIAKLHEEKARDNLARVKLRLRTQENQERAETEDLPGVKVAIKELDDVIFRDVGDKIKDSGKWPLLIDPSGQAATFLRYRDTNYIRALSPKDMEPDRIRMAILGTIRYGKPLVLDMMEVDMYDTCVVRFDEVLPGLLQSIMDKSLLQDERYLKLTRETDGQEYTRNQFNDYRIQKFMLLTVTKNPYPPESLLEMTYPIRVHVAGRDDI